MPLINFIDIKKEDYKFIFFLEKILIIFVLLIKYEFNLIYKKMNLKLFRLLRIGGWINLTNIKLFWRISKSFNKKIKILR